MLYLDQEQGKEANQERSLKRRQQIDLLSASKGSQLPAKQAEQSLIGAAKGVAAGVNFSKSLSSPKNTPTRQSFTGLAAGAAGATGAGKGLGPTIPQPVKRVSPGLAGEAMNRKNTIEANIKKSGAPGAQLLSRTRQPETATAAAPKITLPNYASYMAIEDNPSSDRWWENSENLTRGYLFPKGNISYQNDTETTIGGIDLTKQLSAEEKLWARKVIQDFYSQYPKDAMLGYGYSKETARKMEADPRYSKILTLENKLNPGAAFTSGFYQVFGVDKALDKIGEMEGGEGISSLSMTAPTSQNPLISKTGQVSGQLTKYLGANKVIGKAAGLVPGFSTLSPLVQSMLQSGATMGTVGAYDAAIEGGDAKEVAAAAGRNFAGGVVGSGLSGKILSLGNNLLFRYGLQNSRIANMVLSGLGGTAFSLGNTGTNVAINTAVDPNYEMDAEQVTQDAIAAFLFSAISSYVNTIQSSAQNKARMEQLNRQVQETYGRLIQKSTAMTPAEQRALQQQALEANQKLRSFINGNKFVGAGQEISELNRFLNMIDDGINGTLIPEGYLTGGSGGSAHSPVPGISPVGPSSGTGILSAGDVNHASGETNLTGQLRGVAGTAGISLSDSLTPPAQNSTMESEVHTTGGVDLGRTGEEAQQIREYEPGRAQRDRYPDDVPVIRDAGGENKSSAFGGTAETSEEFFRRGSEEARTVKRVGNALYSYRVIPSEKALPNAALAQQEFAALGFDDVAIIDELQVNRNGFTRIDRGEAVTVPDGSCFIRNDTNADPKEIAGHDGAHMVLHRFPEIYEPYRETVSEGNFQLFSEKSQDFLKEMEKAYFPNGMDMGRDSSKMYREIEAFVSGALNANPEFADAFFGPMFQDWESVKSAQAWMFEQVRNQKNISPVNPTSNRTEANHPQADPDRALRTAGGLLPDGKEAPQNFIGWPIGQGNDSLGFSAGLPDIGGTVQRAAEEVSQFFTPKPPLTGDRRDLSEGFNLDDLGRGESAFDGVRELLAASAADGKANKKAPKTGPANILTETPKVQLRENFEDTAGWAYRKAVDSGHSVEQAAKLVGDEVLYPLYNNAKQAGAAAGYMMGEAQTDLKGNRVGKSLLEIFDPVRAKGEQYFRDFSAYLFHLHNMDRMSLETRGAQVYEELGLDVPADLENKPVFGEEVTAQDSEKAAAELLQKYPEFQQMAQDVYRYNQNLMQYRVDSGLISEKQAQLMNALYPHYVPTFRKTGKSSGMTVFGGQAKVAQTVQKATGSNLDLMPIDDSIARQTVRVISAAKRNLFGNRLLSDALRNRDKIGRYVQSVFDAEAQYDLDTEGEIETPPNLKGQFTVYLSGKPVAMKLDAGMMEGVQALSPQLEYNLVMKGIREANNLYKALITGYNPSFMIRNPLKDIQDAGLYTTDLKGFVRNYPRAVGEIRSNGKMWQLYRSYGGTGSSFFDYEKGLQPKKEGGLIQRIQSVNEALEQLPRLAEFITVVEKGGTGYENVQKALLAAADVTVNFGRSGTWGKSLNQTAVPFLNPSIQGADKLYRTITSTKSGRQWAMLALRVALLGVAPSVINELLYRDDEDYQRLSNRTKDTYFLFKLPKLPGLNLPEGQFLKLPKGRVLSVFGNAAQRTMRTWRGEEDAWDGYLETTLDATAPASPFSSNILTPVLDADLFDPESPGKTWYGGDIEPQRLRSLPPGERYDESTDAISKAIGGFFNLSPKKINYLLDSYTGAIGEYGLPLITPKAEGNPFVNSFVVDSVMSNKYSSQFYDKLDEVTQDKNSANPMPGSAVTNRFLTRKASEFGELYAEMRRIELSSLPNKEKMNQVRKVKEQLNDAQKDTLDALDHYQEAAAKYYAKYSSMEEDDRLDTAYREANREIFGAEYALEVYNKKTYEKAQAVNEKGIPYDTFYRAYFAQKDVQGNKDRKGNTIAGSASENKKKAVDRVISGLTRRQREALYEAFNISKTVW